LNPQISCLICSIERTGSNLLCDALRRTGIAGRPRECFRPIYFAALSNGSDSKAYMSYFDSIITDGTTHNGVFGAKVYWSHLKRLVIDIRQCPEFRTISARDLLKTLFPNLRHIRMILRDKVRQAVSFLKAQQTDIWWEMDPWVRALRLRAVNEPKFDAESIDHLVDYIWAHEVAWQQFFDTCGVQPLELVYEEFVEAYEATTLQVLQYLQIPVPQGLTITAPRLRRQSDIQSEEWVQRYLALRAHQGAGASGSPRMGLRDEDRQVIFPQHSDGVGRPVPEA
jgi:LPS sulfotransferase NodH